MFILINSGYDPEAIVIWFSHKGLEVRGPEAPQDPAHPPQQFTVWKPHQLWVTQLAGSNSHSSERWTPRCVCPVKNTKQLVSQQTDSQPYGANLFVFCLAFPWKWLQVTWHWWPRFAQNDQWWNCHAEIAATCVHLAKHNLNDNSESQWS